MLKASSKFGAQMDSLADIVNFGVAPAFVLYLYLLKLAGPIGWIAVLVFTIAAGLRLARFNVLDEDLTRPAWQAEYFVGVPAPAGAVLVMLPIYLGFLGLERTQGVAIGGTIFAIVIAFLLVSRLPVYSGKKVRVGRDKAVPTLLIVVIFALLLAIYTWQTLSLAALAYLFFLPLSAKAYSRRADIEEAAVQAEKPAEDPR
jgi:CDP-diacylglycerol--serine O-phosphatidyltransferase